MRRIIANYDEEGINVYQAFKPSIVAAALECGTFDKGFGLDRMTWIKPSFGWMLYRSGYATKHRQESILKIKLCHEGLLAILRRGVPTSYNAELYPTSHDWRAALDQGEGRFQWGPDPGLHLRPLSPRG